MCLRKRFNRTAIIIIGLCCAVAFTKQTTVSATTTGEESTTEPATEYTIQPTDTYNAVSIGPYEVTINEEDHTAKIVTAYRNGYVTECPKKVVLPSELKADGVTYKITAIDGGFPAYHMERLIVSEGIETIGPEFCNNGGTLKEIVLPSTVTQIDLPFFSSTISEKNQFKVTISEENKAYRVQDQSLVTADGTYLIRSFAAGEYTVPDGVVTIDSKSFYRNNRVTKVTIPKGVKKINTRAFSMCQSLKEVVMPDTVTSLGQSLFADSKVLEKVTLSKKIKSIPNYCFRNSAIQKIIVPEGVTKIGKDAMLGCIQLNKLSLPSTLKNIEKNPLIISDYASGYETGAPSLAPKNLTMSSKNPYYTIVDGALLNKKKTKLIQMIAASETFTVPSTVKTIDVAAFSHQLQLKKVVLSKNIAEIPKDAFTFSSVEQVVCTGSLKKINENAFSCSRLKTIELKKGLTTIEDGAFNGCDSLEKITIPETVTSIGNYVFYQECGKISITFTGATPPKIGILEQSYSDETQTGYTIYVPKKSLKKYEDAIKNKNGKLKITIKTN